MYSPLKGEFLEAVVGLGGDRLDANFRAGGRGPFQPRGGG